MNTDIFQRLYHATGETKVAIVAAIIAACSAYISLKGNRLGILPVLVLDISDNPKSVKVKLRNIGVGVAHKIYIAPVRVLFNKRTPHRQKLAR